MTARRWAPWFLMAAVVAAALTVGLRRSSGPADNAGRVDAIGQQLKCLECAGESVFESHSQFADTVRKDISLRVSNGESDGQITAALARAYGERILLVPKAQGANVLLWVLPVVAAVLAFGALAIAFARWRRLGSGEPSDEDRALVARAMAHELEDAEA